VAITREEVRHVALLARLTLDDDRLDKVTEQLGRILDHIEKLNELDTEGVEPLSHPLPLADVFRPDERRESLPPEEALKNAPRARRGFFEVPRILQ